MGRYQFIGYQTKGRCRQHESSDSAESFGGIDQVEYYQDLQADQCVFIIGAWGITLISVSYYVHVHPGWIESARRSHGWSMVQCQPRI